MAFSTLDGIMNTSTIEEFAGDPRVSDNGTQVPSILWYAVTSTATQGWTSTQAQHSRMRYGYEVQCLLEFPATHSSCKDFRSSELVTRPKLLLDDGAHLKDLKVDLRAILGHLRQLRIIKRNQDVIGDLLTCLFAHAKYILERDYGLKESSIVEVTLAVPICWSARSNAVMLDCLKKALSATRLVSQPRLFMVNEAEAAAMYVLAAGRTQLYTGECFVLLDCGGGTTDVGTYKIARNHPLRLEEEVVHPKGIVCGLADLNARMREPAITDLQNEDYLENQATGRLIENIVDRDIMPRFENMYKRSFDTAKKDIFPFLIRDLRPNKDNPRIQEEVYVLQFEDMLAIFNESLERIVSLLTDQIELAIDKGIQVDKVVLVGGYGDSPALKHRLKEALARINTNHETTIELISAAMNNSAAGVAKGALLRAQDKSHGPKRVLRRSFGIRFSIPDVPDTEYPAEVLEQRRNWDDYTEEPWIDKTVKWVIKKDVGGSESVHVTSFTVQHPFKAEASIWIVREWLYASDTCTKDFYRRDHRKNRGKTTEVGKVVFDITSLRERMMAQIKPQENAGKEIYYVDLRVRLQVIDTNLEFAAFWPADEEDAEPIPASQISFDVMSAFPPSAM